MEGLIKNLINAYEPRANIQNVTVNGMTDANAYKVTITFYIENATQPTTTTILLERNR